MYLIHFPTLKPLNLTDNKIFNVVGKFSVGFSCITVPAEEIKQNTFFVTQKKLNWRFLCIFDEILFGVALFNSKASLVRTETHFQTKNCQFAF